MHKSDHVEVAQIANGTIQRFVLFVYFTFSPFSSFRKLALMILTRLSKFILLPICTEWLDVCCLCRLDSATCNHVERDHFLSVLQYVSVKCQGLDKIGAFETYLKWFKMRNLFLDNLVVNMKLSIRTEKHLEKVCAHLQILEVVKFDVSWTERLALLTTKCPELRTLFLHSSKGVLTNGSLISIVNGTPNLTNLSVEFDASFWSSFSDRAILHTAFVCPKLKILHLICCGYQLTDASFKAVAKYCTVLHEVYLNDLSGITVDSFQAFVDARTPLTSLDIIHCAGVSASAAIPLMLREVHGLLHFGFNNSSRDYSDLAIVRLDYAIKSLLSLELTGVNVSMLPLMACNQLQKLVVSDCHHRTTIAVGDEFYLQVGANFPQLTELSLRKCSNLNLTTVLAIAGAHSELKVLDASSNTFITLSEANLITILTSCSKLCVLNISGLKVCGATIKDSCDLRNVMNATTTSLKELYIEGVSAFKRGSVEEVIEIRGLKVFRA